MNCCICVAGLHHVIMLISIANQPDTLQKMTNSLLVNLDIPINTKRLMGMVRYPCKIDLVTYDLPS